MDSWAILTDISVLLAMSLVLGAIAIKFKLSPLIGYIAAGMILGGPGSIRLIQSPTEIEAMAELGIALLLFSLGLEFSWSKISNFPASNLKSGIAQLIVTPVISTGICYLLGFDIKLSILIGLILTLSSTATVFRTLMDLREIDSSHGRNATAILLLQDIAVIPFTIIVSSLSSSYTNPGSLGTSIITVLTGSLGLVLALYVILNKIAAPALSWFSLENNREMAVLLAVITSIGSAWAAHNIGISPAIGAFIAGMFLGTSPFATQIRADVSPLRITFITLFFGSAGMVANPIWICKNFLLVISITAIVMLFKTVISTIIFKIFHNTFSSSISSAICISQISEFAFVLSEIAYKLKLLPEVLHQIIISVTIVSLFFTPFIIKFAPRISFILHKILNPSVKYKYKTKDSGLDLGIKNSIFIFGFGAAGSAAAEHLANEKDNIVVIDLSKDCIEHAESFGLKAHIGDVKHIEVLQHYGINKAKLIMITIPGHEAALKAIHNIRRINQSALLVVRSRYKASVKSFQQAGADHVVDEESTVGSKLGEIASQLMYPPS